MPQRKLRFVQFTHPGGEHTVSPVELKAGIKNWNTGPHRRKFIKAEGQVVNGGTLSAPQDLLFWGEWEPYSYVKKIDAKTTPKYVHEPFLQIRGKIVVVPQPLIASSKTSVNNDIDDDMNSCNSCGKTIALQNTDPFVFNDYFLYSLCKQNRFINLRFLDQGSIILFGSSLLKGNGAPCFMVDTVFVVDEWKSYQTENARKDLKGFTPKYYEEIMQFKTGKNILTCYRGATFNHPVGDMFSFVPCKPCVEGKVVGFQRPVIYAKDFPGIITDNLNSTPKFSAISSLANMKCIWDKLCRIIRGQGFELGVNFKYKMIP